MIGMTTAFQAPKNKHEDANAAEHEFQRIKARLHEQLVESFDLSRIGRIDQQALWKEVRKMARTFGDGIPGEPIAVFGSAGYLEIAVNRGNAARTLGANRGAEVSLELT